MSLRLKSLYKDDFELLFRLKCLYMYYFTTAIKKEIGGKIAKIRKSKKLKQADVAEDAGLNASYYGKIERGIVNPSLEKIYRVIKALNVKSSDIFPF